MRYDRLLCCSLTLLVSSALPGCARPPVPAASMVSNSTALPDAPKTTMNPSAEDEATASTIPASDSTETVQPDTVPTIHSDMTVSTAKKESGEDEQSLLDTALELTETAQEYWEDGDNDQAMEALDQAYTLILKVPANNPKLLEQKEDIRFVISKRIMEMYASRQTTVNGTYTAIPMSSNDHVEREIVSFQTVERDFFMESYKRSGRYRAEIVNALKEAGLPEELSWLPLIESGFKVRALSRSRALGLWQFIPSTGYKYGLKRNVWVDERLDPEKSTEAAIAYLKELHQMFGDWATVLAAYNCGEGSVARVIREQKISYLDNFWDFYERLPRETARYFPRFLAVLAILKDPGHYGFNLEEIDSPLTYETATIEKPVQLKTIAEKLDMDVEDLMALNPELRRNATPNSMYALRVPPGKSETVLANIDSMMTWSPPKVEYVTHRVRRGETLSLIALRYRTSTQRIMDANNLQSGKMLRIGQRLKIPMRNTT